MSTVTDQQPFQMIHVVVVETLPLRFAELQSVDQARMHQLVCQDQVAFFGYRRQYARVGHVPAAEYQRGFAAVQIGKGLFEAGIFRTVPGNQPGRGIA